MAEPMRQDAIIRKLEIIGEAVKHLSDRTKQRRPEIPWKQIAGMRDRLTHDYFGVDLTLVPTENLIRTVRVTDRADVGPANDGNVSIAAVHSVNVDEWLASFGRSSGRRAVCTVFRRRPSMAVVRPRDDGSCGAGRPRAASP